MDKQTAKPSEVFEFYTPADIAQILHLSKASAYLVIRRLNEERKKNGKIIFPGRVLKEYFHERI